jgi:internalin A
LQKLFLSHNQFTELPPEIVQLINLRMLFLSGNQLTELPSEIGQMVNLQWLDLKNNKLKKLSSCLRTLFERGQLECDGNPVCDLPQEEWFSDV